MRRDEALRRLAEHRDELAATGAVSLSLFGSVARDEAGPDSDVDILIDLNEGLDLFDLGGIQVRLEEILGCRVDLVMPDALRPRLRTRVLEEAVRATFRWVPCVMISICRRIERPQRPIVIPSEVEGSRRLEYRTEIPPLHSQARFGRDDIP